MKNSLKYFLVFTFVALFALEIYLAIMVVGEDVAGKRKIEKFCDSKCTYNSISYFWEFSGEGAIRGFTTKEECFNHCFKKEQGFIAMAKRYGAAFLSAAFYRDK